MTYSAEAHRQETRDRLLKLVRTGAGMHPYALCEAEKLEKEDPSLHVGLVAAVEAELGPEAVAAARRAAKFMER